MQMQFGPNVVAPAFHALGCIAPSAAATMLASLLDNKAAWQSMGASPKLDPMSVLLDEDGCERVLHIFGGSTLQEDAGPDVHLYVSFIPLLPEWKATRFAKKATPCTVAKVACD
jgi:hypothetical protein